MSHLKMFLTKQYGVLRLPLRTLQRVRLFGTESLTTPESSDVATIPRWVTHPILFSDESDRSALVAIHELSYEKEWDEWEQTGAIPRAEDYDSDVHLTLKNVVDAGSGWLVLDKPSGLPLFPPNASYFPQLAAPRNDGQKPPSVYSQLIDFFQKDRHQFIRDTLKLPHSWKDSPQIFFPYPVEFGTSGLLFVAFDKKIAEFVASQRTDHRVLETCYSVVQTVDPISGLSQANFASHFTWANFKARLTRDKGTAKRVEGRGTVDNPKIPISLKFRCVATDDDDEGYALLQFQLRNGALVKDMIRRVAAVNDTPVVGDWRYGASKARPFVSSNGRYRIGMHIGRLALMVPNRRNRWKFKATLPNEFKNLFSKGLKMRGKEMAVDWLR